jgi:hypothetical protein
LSSAKAGKVAGKCADTSNQIVAARKYGVEGTPVEIPCDDEFTPKKLHSEISWLLRELRRCEVDTGASEGNYCSAWIVPIQLTLGHGIAIRPGCGTHFRDTTGLNLDAKSCIRSRDDTQLCEVRIRAGIDAHDGGVRFGADPAGRK